MADAVFIRNISGVEVAPDGDSYAYFVPEAAMSAYFEEEMQEAVMVGQGDTFFDNLTFRNIAVSRLVGIAHLAESALDGPIDVSKLLDLAVALRDAGFADHTGGFIVIGPDGERVQR